MQLVLKNINKTYKKGAKKALDGFSVTFNKGIYALLGPNGSGKSTLMNIITGIIPKDSGNIEFYENDEPKSYANSIGFLPQNQDYYNNFTALDFILYMMVLKKYNPEDKKAYANKILNSVNLINEKDKKIGAFSGGMKQRLGIAQALIGEPKIIIFDEPTAGLDPKERVRFRNVLAGISENKIIIISTHIVSDVSVIAKEAVLLSKGKVLKTGTQKELCKEMQGKVWRVKCDYPTAMLFMTKYKVSSIVEEDGEYSLRLLSKEKPTENCENVPPVLEDLYLYEFGEEEGLWRW